ncbi:unnamed protein product, partial [Vitis vinifera]
MRENKCWILHPTGSNKQGRKCHSLRLQCNLTSASSALQGLLRKLGAGLDELLPSAAVAATPGSGRLKKILSSLREEGEEGRKIEALTQLCDLLLMGTEDSLCAFPVDSFVPVLVELLNYESNADIMLLAARAITHLCDVLPSSCSAVLHYGAVRCFCAKLLEIECMDLAEQSLQALKKISQEQPTACLRAGALMAVLSFLDFFPTGVQRVALSTAANMCKKLPPDAADFVMEAVPLLTNLLQYQDSTVLEHSSVCLTRIVEAIASSPDKLDELCNHGLIEQVTALISTSNSGGVQASLSTSTYTGLIRLLSICAKGSPLGAKTLLHLEISGILKDILPVSSLIGSVSVPPSLTRPPDQIFEIVNLADELLPPLPEGTISHLNYSSFQMRSSAGEKSPSSGSGKEEITNGSMPEASAREKLLCDQPKFLQQFGVDLLPVLVQVYGSTVNVQVRNKCLSVIGKLMYFCTADMILSLLNSTNISSFLAGVLASKDPQVLIPGLQMAEILMEKLPKTFSRMFVREGVLHAVDTLISHDLENVASVEIPSRNSRRLAVSTRAKAFKHKYFPSCPGEAEVGVTDDLLRLKNLCVELNLCVNDQNTKRKGKSKASGPNLTNPSANAVSTFEFISSGVVAALLNYFSCGAFSMVRTSEANLSKLRRLAFRRFKSFIAVALPSSIKEGDETPLIILIRNLQNALSSLERFPVVLSHSSRSSSGNARFSSGLSALSQPFKLHLRRAQGDKSLRDYSSNIVLIDPLASLSAVEEFLWPRVLRSELGQKKDPSFVENLESETPTTETGASLFSTSNPACTYRHPARSRSSVAVGGTSVETPPQGRSENSMQGKGKALQESAQDEERGPLTRNIACRGTASDKDLTTKPDFNPEDREVNISPVEIDDGLVIEEDDLSDDEDDANEDVLRNDVPFCTSEKVHDVKLGDPVEDGMVASAATEAQSNPRSGSNNAVNSVHAFGSKGTMSIAASVAIGGLVPPNRGGIRTGYGEIFIPSHIRGQTTNNPTYNILALLRVLECLIPPEKFINSKITPKLSRQIQDALAVCGGTLPSWCYQLTKACPFLFPFETRRQYFYSTAFGLSRALNWLQQQQGADGQGSASEREVRLGRLQRQKVRVSRNRILDSARKVMEMYSSQKAVLEVEYFGEVGTGLGPTLEFYTLLSHDLQKAELGMWRSRSGVLVQAPLGLFPRPWSPTADASDGSPFAKVIEYYHLLGQVMAKALQDGRLLDLPLSMAFYKLVLGQDLDLHDILSFDAELGKILQELQVLVCRKQYLDGVSGNGCDATGGLCFRGAPVEDLCLDFTLPGYPDYILKSGYENVLVDSDNLDEYVSLVVDATVKSGLMHQMEAFRAGFNQVFDISSLQIFSPHELDYLLCGRRELWKMETLVDHIKFDHGYTAKSPAIINLLEIMGEFTPEQQHAFCQFITGAPRLPPGGLAMLNPKLTIVRKHSSTMNPATNMIGPSESADEDLPSVMTCANYLKLPPYSTKDIMYKKLLYAINEGQGSFDLS